MAQVIITTATVVEIPDEVYGNLLLMPKTKEEDIKWRNAGEAVAKQYADGKWAYTNKTGLVNVKTLDGELLCEG